MPLLPAVMFVLASLSSDELVDPATFVGNVYGTVLAKNGTPIANATVVVSGDGVARTATTRHDGTFLINSIPAPYDGRRYSVVASHPSYARAELDAHVFPGAVMALEATFRLASHISVGKSRYRHERSAGSPAGERRLRAGATSIGADWYTATVFATREGLVGGTTANGHIIVPNDRFAALPSRRALATRFGYERQVRVSVNGRTTVVPVWDVGPWNTRDDYWNPPSIRQTFTDLPRGKPESEAAFLDGYNGGLDERGRVVRNPAGIDLADGTFWIDLALINNAWVEVEYLWVVPEGVPLRRRAAGR